MSPSLPRNCNRASMGMVSSALREATGVGALGRPEADPAVPGPESQDTRFAPGERIGPRGWACAAVLRPVHPARRSV